MRRTYDFQGEDEIETESYNLSSISHTQSPPHSESHPDLSTKNHVRNNSDIQSTKSSSSIGKKVRTDNYKSQVYGFRQQLVALAVLTTIVLLLLIIIIGLLKSSRLESAEKRQTGSSSAFSSLYHESGHCFDGRKGKSEGFSDKCNGLVSSSSVPSLLRSKYDIYESFVHIQPEEVKCYAWVTFLTLKISMFWRSCNNPKHLFSNNNNLAPQPLPSLTLNLETRKKWTYKAEIVSFEIKLLDAIRVQGLALHLDEFQIQYYLRNNLWLQLYGNYRSPDRDDANHHQQQTGNANSILLLNERLSTQNIVRDSEKVLMMLFLFQDNKYQFSSLSLRLGSKTTIFHQIISIEVLEPKTYNKKTNRF